MHINSFQKLIYLNLSYLDYSFYIQLEAINARFTSSYISILKSRTRRRRGIICIERDDSQASFRSRKAVRASPFNPGAFVTRVTHFTAPHAPAIPSRNVQDPRRSSPLLLRYFTSFSFASSLHPSTTLAYSRGWQSVAERRGMSQKRDKRLTLPARETSTRDLKFCGKRATHSKGRFLIHFSTRVTQIWRCLGPILSRDRPDMAKVIRFFRVCISIACGNFVLWKIRIWNSNVPNL